MIRTKIRRVQCRIDWGANVSGHDRQFSNFRTWFLKRLIVPALPIILQAITSWYFPEYAYDFPNQTVIVMAFVFPLVTMVDTTKRNIQLLLYSASSSALVLFMLFIFAQMSHNSIRAKTICYHGLYLFVIITIGHLAPKVHTLLRRPRGSRQKQRVTLENSLQQTIE